MKSQEPTEINLQSFNIKSIIGRGAYGKVYLAELPESGELYAIKAIRKDVLLDRGNVKGSLFEQAIMLNQEHPNLANMKFIFQTDLRLYFVMPFIKGSELYKVFSKNKRFSESVVKFIATQIVYGVGALHEQGYMHRDLKLENIMLDENGYIKLIDFGLAENIGKDRQTMCGTAEYMAPEMVLEKGHEFPIDWWAVGILIYEMLIGISPFFNKNRNKLFEKIVTMTPIFPDRKRYNLPYSDELVDLITKLLDKKPASRLGSVGDAKEVLSHPWFADVDHDKLLSQELPSPCKPFIEGILKTDFQSL